MFKALFNWFRAENLLSQAKNQVLEMLKIVQGLFDDSVQLFWTGQGVTIDDIRKRDREINHLVRDVRKKVLTHLAFTGSGDLDMSLVMVNIVVFIERIGDYTKDIGYLATDYPGAVKAGELEQRAHAFESELSARIKTLVQIFSRDDDEAGLARQLTGTHKELDRNYRELIQMLMAPDKNTLTPSDSAKLALYMRYLRRVEGHIFNIASSEVNPFHRISFKVKKTK